VPLGVSKGGQSVQPMDGIAQAVGLMCPKRAGRRDRGQSQDWAA